MIIRHVNEAAFLRAFGAELRARREQRGWTRQDLIRRLGEDLSHQTIGSYESGIRNATVARLAQLCCALDVSPADMVAKTIGAIRDDRRVRLDH